MIRAGLTLLAVVLAGCADGAAHETAWHGRDLSDPAWRQQRLQPGESVRYDVQLYAPKTLEWNSFVNERTLSTFALHQHTSQGYSTLARVQTEEDQGTHQARSGPHSFTWTNDAGTTATLWWEGPTGGFLTLYGPGQDPVKDECQPVAASTAPSAACLQS
jgi:hypothetical protein